MNQSTRFVYLSAAFLFIFFAGRAMSQPARTIPAGTAIAIRTIDAIDSKGADLNHEYAASLADPITVDDVEIAPRGANAILRIEEARKAGAVTGRASLTLRLTALTVNGQRVAVESGDITSKSGSQGAQTAKHSGVGAAVGGGIGAVAGGGLGAVIGASAGAGAGALISAMRGQRVRVPAETRLTFTLAQPASLPTGLAASAAPPPVPQVQPTASAPAPPPQAPQLHVHSPKPELIVDGIRVQLQGCYRKAAQAVCEVLLEALAKDMTMGLNINVYNGNRSFVVDSQGLQQYVVKAALGSNSTPGGAETFVVQSVPVHGKLEFAAVDPGASSLAMLNLLIISENREHKFIFRGIPLQQTR
jgi:hypothetical protein